MQHLDFLSEDEKAVFKTAFEIDQRWLIDLAGDRSDLIDQAQSLNVFLPANIHKRDLHQIHYQAWKKVSKAFTTAVHCLFSGQKKKTQTHRPRHRQEPYPITKNVFRVNNWRP